MALAPGTRLGPYAIVAPLGAGGMGEVYQARDPRLDRTVALKVLPSEFNADSVDGGKTRAASEQAREARRETGLVFPRCSLSSLHEKGGMERVLAAHARFSGRCRIAGAARNLEHMWDGIGDWRG